MKLTAAQTKVINSLKDGKDLTAYQNRNRFVFNAGKDCGYTVNAKTVNPLIVAGILKASPFEYGEIIKLAA